MRLLRGCYQIPFREVVWYLWIRPAGWELAHNTFTDQTLSSLHNHAKHTIQ